MNHPRRITRNARGDLRAGWRLLIFFGLMVGLMVPVVVAIVIGFAVQAGLSPDAGPPDVAWLARPSFDNPWMFWSNVLQLLVVVVASLLMIWLFERRGVATLGLAASRSTARDLVWGWSLGWLAMTAVFAVLAAAGVIQIELQAGSGVAWFARRGAYYLVFFLVAAAFEEVLCRGYLLQVLAEGAGAVVAVIVTSLFFVVLHSANPGMGAGAAVQIFTAGCVLAIAYLRTRALWLPIALHAAWNFTQGFIYGLPVSGVTPDDTLLAITSSGPGWLTGGDFGPEGGIVAVLVLAVLAVLVARLPALRVDPSLAAAWSAAEREAAAQPRITAEAEAGER